MTDVPHLFVVEPSPLESFKRAAKMFVQKERGEGEDVKGRLRQVRADAKTENRAFTEQLRSALAQYPLVKTMTARDAGEAVSHIAAIAGKTRLASINRSSIVVNELRSGLHAAGFDTYLRYYGEFRNFEDGTFEKTFKDYWSLPDLCRKGVAPSFDARRRVRPGPGPVKKDYIAVLGVNAISASDGSVYFLQHMGNISRDLEQAKRVILVVGIEKILRNSEDALLHTRAMGIFGLESMLLDLDVKEDEKKLDLDRLPPADGVPQEFHIVLYDNNRSALLESAYSELFTCIDCRACARQCPVGQQMLMKKGMIFSPRNYLMAFLQGVVPSVEACLHCGRCKVECPLDIDIPGLLWRSQIDHYAHRRRGWKKRMLDNPEALARLGSLAAPLSNWASRLTPAKVLMQGFTGVHRKANLPAFHRMTFRSWLRETDRG